VTCQVTGAACIVFGAPNISLWLNGFTITGQGEPRGSLAWGSCPTEVPFERAIDTDLQNNVRILGPGLIGEFRERGILISGKYTLVQDVVVSSTCLEGIFMEGSNNDLEDNTVTRSSLTGNFLASIFVTGTGNHTVRNNQVTGAGPIASSAVSPYLGGEGIFIGGLGGVTGTPSNNNLIIGNIASGNAGTGIFVASNSTNYPNSTGNKIIGNSVFGNSLVQDIYDNNPPGSNTYKGNGCEVSFGADAPTCPNLPLF
jgi:parallel beta-helix repeat protein